MGYQIDWWYAHTNSKLVHLAVNLTVGCFSIAGNQLERLLILESEFGTLPGYKPALDAVIAFMMTVRFSAIVDCLLTILYISDDQVRLQNIGFVNINNY